MAQSSLSCGSVRSSATRDACLSVSTSGGLVGRSGPGTAFAWVGDCRDTGSSSAPAITLDCESTDSEGSEQSTNSRADNQSGQCHVSQGLLQEFRHDGRGDVGRRATDPGVGAPLRVERASACGTAAATSAQAPPGPRRRSRSRNRSRARARRPPTVPTGQPSCARPRRSFDPECSRVRSAGTSPVTGRFRRGARAGS